MLSDKEVSLAEIFEIWLVSVICGAMGIPVMRLFLPNLSIRQAGYLLIPFVLLLLFLRNLLRSRLMLETLVLLKVHNRVVEGLESVDGRKPPTSPLPALTVLEEIESVVSRQRTSAAEVLSASLLLNRAVENARLRDFERALGLYQRLIWRFCHRKELPFQEILAIAYSQQAVVFSRLHKHQLAMEYFALSNKLCISLSARRLFDTLKLCNLLGIGCEEMLLQNHDGAIEQFKSIISAYYISAFEDPDITIQRIVAEATNLRTVALFASGQCTEALRSAQQALRVIRTLRLEDPPFLKAEALISLARARVCQLWSSDARASNIRITELQDSFTFCSFSHLPQRTALWLGIPRSWPKEKYELQAYSKYLEAVELSRLSPLILVRGPEFSVDSCSYLHLAVPGMASTT